MSGDAHPADSDPQKQPTDAHHDGHDDGHDDGHSPYQAHHFDTMKQQFEAGKLGMWLFLATEVLLFGGLFCFYTVYKSAGEPPTRWCFSSPR